MLSSTRRTALILIGLCFSLPAVAGGDHGNDAYDTSRPDSHAPIHVMGDHIHGAGEWMVSYRFMRMNMEGLQDGKDDLSKEDFFASDQCQNNMRKMCAYADEMTMDMHMLGLMYAPTDSTTLMAMVNYLDNSMDMTMQMEMNMGGGMMMPMLMQMPMDMESSGLGDTKLGALQSLYKSDHSRLHVNLVLSLPTGSINEEIDAPNMAMADGRRMAYTMQLGSGTYDFEPAITYAQQFEHVSWGAQAKAVVRLNENKHDYKLGDKYQAQTWVQVPFLTRYSASARLQWDDVGEVRGADEDIEALAMVNPLANGKNYGGSMISAGLGLNAVVGGGHRLALEYVNVLEQNSNGIQMTLEDYATLGWQFAF